MSARNRRKLVWSKILSLLPPGVTSENIRLVKKHKFEINGVRWSELVDQEWREIYGALHEESIHFDISCAEKIKIEKDIHRTYGLFCRHNARLKTRIEARQEEFQSSLQAVLLATSHQRNYCQGINFLVAAFILAEGSERDAFIVLSYLMRQRNLEVLFNHKCSCLLEYMKLFEKKLRQNNKRVYKYFREIGFGSVCYAIEWFTTCFVVTNPGDLSGCVLDLLLIGVPDAMISVGLAIIDVLESQIFQFDLEELQVKFRKLIQDVDVAEVIARALQLEVGIYGINYMQRMAETMDRDCPPAGELTNTLRQYNVELEQREEANEAIGANVSQVSDTPPQVIDEETPVTEVDPEGYFADAGKKKKSYIHHQRQPQRLVKKIMFGTPLTLRWPGGHARYNRRLSPPRQQEEEEWTFTSSNSSSPTSSSSEEGDERDNTISNVPFSSQSNQNSEIRSVTEYLVTQVPRILNPFELAGNVAQAQPVQPNELGVQQRTRRSLKRKRYKKQKRFPKRNSGNVDDLLEGGLFDHLVIGEQAVPIEKLASTPSRALFPAGGRMWKHQRAIALRCQKLSKIEEQFENGSVLPTSAESTSRTETGGNGRVPAFVGSSILPTPNTSNPRSFALMKKISCNVKGDKIGKLARAASRAATAESQQTSFPSTSNRMYSVVEPVLVRQNRIGKWLNAAVHTTLWLGSFGLVGRTIPGHSGFDELVPSDSDGQSDIASTGNNQAKQRGSKPLKQKRKRKKEGKKVRRKIVVKRSKTAGECVALANSEGPNTTTTGLNISADI